MEHLRGYYLRFISGSQRSAVAVRGYTLCEVSKTIQPKDQLVLRLRTRTHHVRFIWGRPDLVFEA